MRISTDFTKINANINKYSDIINKGGYDQSQDMKRDKLSLDTEISIIDQQISSNQSIEQTSNFVDDVMSEITTDLNRFKTLIIKYSEGTLNNKDEIKTELSSLKDFIKFSLNQQNGQDYIFSGTKTDTKPFQDDDIYKGNYKDTKLLVSDGVLKDKLLAPTFLNTKDGNILQDLEGIINDMENSDNLNKIDEILKNVNIFRVENGSNADIALSKKKSLKSLKLSSEEIFESKYKNIEYYIFKLNEITVQYQAMASVLNKVQNLSLVNYI